jgi:uncharacterized Zn-binding protein involved in type VI secretion
MVREMKTRAARLGDDSTCKSHAVGPIIDASNNVLINQLPAARQQDNGQHRTGEREGFFIAEGAPCVLVNGRRMARQLDRVANAHGVGRVISGSPNVLVGDHGKGIARHTPSKITVTMWLHGMLLPGVRVSTSTGGSGVTGKDGTVTLRDLPQGVTIVAIGEYDIWTVLLLGGEWLRLTARLATPADNCMSRISRTNFAEGKRS